MGCTTCAVDKNGTPQGCGDKGHCNSGSCNKLNTFDWLTHMEISDPSDSRLVEVSFKKGARKDFFYKPDYLQAETGDMVVVDSGTGYNVGRVSLSGELVKLQMKKKRVPEDREFNKVLRIANNRDLEKLFEARAMEKRDMVRARVIARTLGLEMKVGDVEYQGDKRKATFYYTAEGRVDFRELVRQYAKEFKVKIEMRQIGARQESSRIGGIGSCGRELCCSTWLTDFKSVSTTTARYQYMAINQSKLSGQCGRLKCCLNYELDTYLDALKDFPKKVDSLKLKNGRANLLKIDIFKGIMVYGIQNELGRGPIVNLTNKQVFKIKEMIDRGEYPEDLSSFQTQPDPSTLEVEPDFEDVTGVFELKETPKKRRNKNRNSGRSRNSNNRNNPNNKNKPNTRRANPKKSDNTVKGSDTAKEKPGTGAPKKNPPKASDNRAKNPRRPGRPKNTKNTPKSNQNRGDNNNDNSPKE